MAEVFAVEAHACRAYRSQQPPPDIPKLIEELEKKLATFERG